MKCLILAAGYATRLYPLTENFPKPLLKVGNKTILDWLVDDIEDSGEIDEYVIISNHKFVSLFHEWVASKSLRITVIDDGTETNETRLGAVADIKYALETLNISDDVLILAGDNVLDFSLKSFINYAKEKKASCVMRYYEGEKAKLQKTGVLKMGDSEQILEMQEKPSEPASNWACPPFYFYKKEDIARLEDAIKDGCGIDAPGSFIAWLCKKTKVFAMEMPGSRYDIGDKKSYEMVQATYRGIV